MVNLLEIIKMDKVDVVDFLLNNDIPFKKRKGVYVFEQKIADVNFVLNLHICDGQVISIIAHNSIGSLTDSSHLDTLKEYFTQLGLNIVSDSTNNQSDNYSIDFSNDDTRVGIFSQKKDGQWDCGIFVSRRNFAPRQKGISAIEWIIYSVIGFFFGLVQFANYSDSDDAPIMFFVCIFFGLLWSTLLGLVHNHFTRKNQRTKQQLANTYRPEEGDYQLIVPRAKAVSKEPLLLGKLYIGKKRSYRTKKAVVSLQEDRLHIYYMNGLTLLEKVVRIDEIVEYLPNGHIQFGDNKEFCVFVTESADDFHQLQEQIDEKVGLKSEEYLQMKSIVQQIILQYDPYSLHKLHDEDFSYEAEIVARKLFMRKDTTQQQLAELLEHCCDLDEEASFNLAQEIMSKVNYSTIFS